MWYYKLILFSPLQLFQFSRCFCSNLEWAIVMQRLVSNISPKSWQRWWCLLCTRPIRLVGFINRNNSQWVDISLHSDTLSSFRANQFFLLLLIATRLAEKKKIPEYLEKTTNLLQVTDQFYYMLYGVNRAGFKLTTAPYGIIKQGRTFWKEMFYLHLNITHKKFTLYYHTSPIL